MAENTNADLGETRNFDLASFARAREKMIATNDAAYRGTWESARNRTERLRDYSLEEVERIISSGSLNEQQKLSRNYFAKDGYYKQIIIYYATLLKYMGLLIPNPRNGKNLSTPNLLKRYNNALDFVENMNLPVLLANIAQRALVDGCYYGCRVEEDKNSFQVIDLPVGYACSRFKDIYGNDIIEFDLSYFKSIADDDSREAALAAYPKIVTKSWRAYAKGRRKTRWVVLPKEIGVCFPFFDGRPIFLNVIPATIEYDEAVASQRDRDAEEIRKIIVQKVPHLSDGRLLFEPEEAADMHQASVEMLRGNKNLNVLTTYTDVDAISSRTNVDNSDDVLTRIEQNIYAQAGTSGQIFASTGGSSLEVSLKNDLALMMYLANKFSRFITNILNMRFANGDITFTYSIMPVSYYNAESFIDSSYKIVGSGYSALMPALAYGLSQRDLVNLKDLENDVLKLGDRLKPLMTSYTQSSSEENSDSDGGKAEEASKTPVATDINEGGRPRIKEENKADKTIENQESLDRTGGGS